MKTNLYKLVEGLVTAKNSYKEINISGIKTNSDEVIPGDLFIAVQGT